MAQAERIRTAIRELMSRGQAPKSTSAVRVAHAEFVAALPVNVRRPLEPDTNTQDLEGRTDRLEKVFAALHAYVAVISAETAPKIPGRTLERHYLDGPVQQFSADVLGAVRDAAAEMRERENGRVS